MQVVEREQLTEVSRVPLEIDDVVIQLVKLLVLRLVPPPPVAIPTASHTSAFAHETAVSRFTDGSSSTDQFVPSWVPTMAWRAATVPIDTQVNAVAQETLVSEFKPEGGLCGFQVSPSDVLTIPIPPTAVHSMIVKHEIDCAGNVGSWTTQLPPPSVDFMIPCPPPA